MVPLDQDRIYREISYNLSVSARPSVEVMGMLYNSISTIGFYSHHTLKSMVCTLCDKYNYHPATPPANFIEFAEGYTDFRISPHVHKEDHREAFGILVTMLILREKGGTRHLLSKYGILSRTYAIHDWSSYRFEELYRFLEAWKHLIDIGAVSFDGRAMVLNY